MHAERRTFIKAAGVAAAAGPLMAGSGAATADGQTADLQRAFDRLEAALAGGDLDGFYGLIDDDAVIIDEDIPFILSKADFIDHIDFHLTGIWENFSWQSRDPQFRVFGNTGIVASFATFRGKPVDSGYRQRHLTFTQGWNRFADGWRLVNWHQSPIDGHVIEGSPG
ncbi:MAG: nuclear transport factor 2 family protein [Sphingomonadales bacterium]|nr:nuclear transport factor 2 family protein [Sphingomonadales bacterium]